MIVPPENSKQLQQESLQEMRYLYHYALEYWEYGFNVVGVIPGTKRPIGMWKKFQDDRVAEEELKRWFIETQGLGIGLVTGRISGIVVVDFEREAMDQARKFWQEHPTALISKTGGGGIHLFYQYAPYGCRTKVGGKPVDVRGDGGFVVLPPTVHPETERMYEWIEWPVDMDKVPVFDPTWIPGGQVAGQNGQVGGEIGHARSYISRIVAISGQGGHNATFRAACKLRDAGLSEAEALAEMIDWNNSGNAQPQWELKELVHKVRDSYRVASQGMQRQQAWMEEQMGQACCEGGKCHK